MEFSCSCIPQIYLAFYPSLLPSLFVKEHVSLLAFVVDSNCFVKGCIDYSFTQFKQSSAGWCCFFRHSTDQVTSMRLQDLEIQ